MQKLFFEVFPTLNVRPELKSLLSEVYVTKASSNRARDSLRIYLLGTRLIQKKYIFYLERSIKEQLFPRNPLTVKIIEKYTLSGQYNPQKLMDVYKDSILEEFKSYSMLEYNLLRCAKMEFPKSHIMKLSMEESVIASQKSEEVVQILEKIVCERCGLDMTVQVEFVPGKESRHKKDSDLKMANEIRHIIASAGRMGQGDDTYQNGETHSAAAKHDTAVAQTGIQEAKGQAAAASNPLASKSSGAFKRQAQGRDGVFPLEEIFPEKGVRSNVPTTRMWCLDVILKRTRFPLNRLRERWGKWSSGGRF